jgi:hypothetical protein
MAQILEEKVMGATASEGGERGWVIRSEHTTHTQHRRTKKLMMNNSPITANARETTRL